MGLAKKLDEGDIAILEILEDEVWCGEFLRSTSDGEVNRALWPPHKWKYRDYQRQLLTDRNKFIVLTGGRAIGKCQPWPARVLTTEGYEKVGYLARKRYFTTFALSPNGELVQRRAICVPDKIVPCYTVVTKSGHRLNATANHPVLTPTGYKLLMNLDEGDMVAVSTWIPHLHQKETFKWSELRILGYLFGLGNFIAKDSFTPKYAKIGAELEIIADQMYMNWHKDGETGKYTFPRKPGPFKHPIVELFDQIGVRQAMKQRLDYDHRRVVKVPAAIKQEKLEHIKIFLEAYIAQYSDVSARQIIIKTLTKRFAYDIQELLLKFGVESSVDVTLNTTTIHEHRALYRFWNEFSLPGVKVANIKPPQDNPGDVTSFMRFEPIIQIYQSQKKTNTFAIYVYEDNNYISDNVFVHNTIVVQDKIVFEAVNSDIVFPETKEETLVTPNQAQMTPLLGKLISRFSNGRLIKDFLGKNINRSLGVMTFKSKPAPFTFHFRIAGSDGQANMVK